ncbi:MAG TPA: ATP-binding cassette domain-containing protein [Acidimicrobiales bacterium]|nr:ATP-binding cassette domain-containing protein [Acidimicrobiales bacterium]
MEKFLTLCVSGAVTGAIYSLVASGLVLSYSATGIFNFAYGGIAFAAAYLYYEFNGALHYHIVPSALLVILVFAPLLGLLLDWAVFRPLARASESAKIVACIGLLIAIPGLTEWITDGIVDIFNVHHLARSSTVLQVGFPSGLGPVPADQWHLGKIPFNSNEMVVFASAVLCAVGLWYLMRRTSLGLRMRAVVDRASLARMRGVDDALTSRYAWVIGTMLAALAGVVGSPILGTISTDAWIGVVFAAAAAAVIGGLRSIPLAFAGGLLLGVAQNLVTGYATFAASIPGFNESVPTLLLLVTLVVMGAERGRRAGSTSEESLPPDYLAHLPRWRRALPWTLALVFLVFYILLLSDKFWAGVMAQGLALSLVFMSFVVVTGMGGMVSLAQATFVTAAGLTTGVLFQHYGVPFFGAAAIGVLAAVALGLVIALPALRLGGLQLALATLALALLGDNVLFQWKWLTNNQSGWTLPRPEIGPLHLSNNRTMAICLLVVVLVVMLLINNLQRSLWGRSIAAVRSSEVGASTSGISPLRVKLALFGVSAAIAGIGGIAYASFQTSMSATTTPAAIGYLWLATVVLFGIRRPVAAAWAGIGSAMTPVIIGSGFHWWSWVPTWLSWDGTPSSEIPLILFGLGAVTLARNPDGFLAANARQRYERRLRRLASQPAGTPESREVSGEMAAELAASEEAAAGLAETRLHAARLEAEQALGRGTEGEEDSEALLAVRGLHAGYGEVEVLHGVDLNVRSGRITALFGANGSGKSTLCSTLGGLLNPQAGRILLDGQDLTPVPAYRRVRRGMLVAPESRGIFPGLTVEENLTLRLGPADREEVFRRFPGLRDRRRLVAGSLSGGEQQMLTLAPVVVRPPRLVVVDEPTLGLAPLVIEQLIGLFRDLRDQGTAILLVEEKVRDVLQIADDAVFLELGRVVWSGPRSEVSNERLVGAYLGAQLDPSAEAP